MKKNPFFKNPIWMIWLIALTVISLFSQNTFAQTCVNETFTALSGTIEDGSGSSDYSNDQECVKFINVQSGYTITLAFNSFNTEADYDFVSIYDGSPTSNVLLGTYSGTTFPPTFTSSANQMVIVFTSDYSEVRSGWQANYTTQTTSTLNAPSNLALNVVSCSQINLTWTDNSTNESNFTVERKTGSGGTYSVISSTIPANSTSYSNTGLTASTTYFYRVKATNGALSSAYCNEISASTSACTSGGETIWQSTTGGVYYNGGKVGIGTSSPEAKLDLLTDHTSQIPIRITHNNYNDWVLMKRRSDNSQQFGIKEENGEGCMGLATAGLTRMTIDQFGYVGIGITNPSSYDTWARNLVVGNTSGNAGITILSNSSNYGSLIFADGTGNPADEMGMITYEHNNNKLHFYANNKQAVTIDQDGRVGIGTASPMANLDIRGSSIRIQDSYMTQPYSINASDILVNYVAPLNRNGIRVPVYFTWADQGTSDAILTLDKSGNVGIGCYKPAAKLTVNGGIRATRIDITQTVPCSDHVFNSDYKLMNLADLDAFIKANKHLPEVPSAKEFEENGYSVGDMDNLLLKKVEELTLYILEQQKKIETLENEIQQLKK